MIDNSKIINDEIKPKIEEIKKICAMYKIPFFFTVLESDDGTSSKYISEIESPTVADKSLTSDKITPLINVMNGFDTVPPMYSVYDLP